MTTTWRVAAAAAAVLISAAPVAGQTFGYGGKAGVNFSSVSFAGDAPLVVSAKAGLVAGGFVTLPLGGRLSLEVDGYYSERTLGFEGEIVHKLVYIELPILVRFRVLTKESWSVSATGGAALGFLLKAEETFPDDSSFDIKSTVESFETSAVAGAQVEIGRHIVVDVRFLWGLTNVSASADFPAKHRGFQITGGYRF